MGNFLIEYFSVFLQSGWYPHINIAPKKAAEWTPYTEPECLGKDSMQSVAEPPGLGINNNISDQGVGIHLGLFKNPEDLEKREILDMLCKGDKWVCPICEQELAQKFSLQRHLRGGAHRQDDPIVIDLLDKLDVVLYWTPKEQDNREIQGLFCKGNMWVCPLCQLECISKSMLKKHLGGMVHEKDTPQVLHILEKLGCATGGGALTHVKNRNPSLEKWDIPSNGEKRDTPMYAEKGEIPLSNEKLEVPVRTVESSRERERREIREMFYRDGKWVCLICKDRGFSVKCSLQKHLKDAHPQDDPQAIDLLKKLKGSGLRGQMRPRNSHLFASNT